MAELELEKAVSQIYIILWLICILGMIMMGAIMIMINKLRQRASLERYRSTKMGFADMLNYASTPSDGVVVCKNGALMATFHLKGPDQHVLSIEDCNRLSEQLNNVFLGFDTGMAFHMDVIRRPAPAYFDKKDSFFPDRVTAAIEQDRANFFKAKDCIYDSDIYMSVTWLPPLLTTQKLVKAMYTNDGVIKKTEKKATLDLIEEFEKKLTDIENHLSIIYEIKRLKCYTKTDEYGVTTTYDPLLSWLYFCISGTWQEFALSETPLYIDQILAEDFKSGVIPIIGNKYIRTISIEGLRSSTSPGMLNCLSEIGCAYRWDTRYIAMDMNESESYMKKHRKLWNQKKRGFLAQLFNLPTSNINRDAYRMIEEAEGAIQEIQSQTRCYGFLTQVLVLMDENYEQLENNVLKIMKLLRNLGLKPRLEEINTMESYMGSLPAHCYENVRRPVVSTMNCADLVPVYTPWQGSRTSPCPFTGYKNAPALMQCVTGASYNLPFSLNLHVQDLGHTLILGPTGSGKSTLLCTLACQFMRYKRMKVISFDKGKSMYCLAKATGGQHYEPAGENSLSFCPLAVIENEADLGWAIDWIQSMIELNNVTVSPEISKSIQDTLTQMWSGKQAAQNGGSEYDMSLTNFTNMCQNEDVRQAMSTYTIGQGGDNPLGRLLDGKEEEDGLHEFSGFTVFEIERLMGMGDKYCLPVLQYLFYRIHKSLDGNPAVIFLDEAWIMLGNPTFRGKIKEWLKVLRKANCALVLATQSLSDADNSGILDVLVESCPSKIFLPNPTATNEITKPLYRKFGLNDAQIQIIATGEKKRDYYYVSDTNAREFRLALDKFQLAFVGVSDKKDLQKIDELIASDPDNWVENWIAFKGVSWPENFYFVPPTEKELDEAV